MLLPSCTEKKKDGEQQKLHKDELVLAIGEEPDEGFDPTRGWGQYSSPLIQSTLLKYDKDFNVEYDLAKDYKVSEDGRKWTVALKDSIQFSNGNPLTAKDVVFTYKLAKDSQSIIDLTNLDKIEHDEDHRVIFHLKKRNSTFIEQLTSIGIVTEKDYSDDYAKSPIGSGPYVLEQWDKDEQVILKSNPKYHGEKPFFQKLTFVFLSEDARLAAAKSGQVDIASIPPSFAEAKIDDMKLISLKSVENRGVVLPFTPDEGKKVEGKPIGNDVTADKALRKAMNVAVDREKLVEGVLNGYGYPAYTLTDNLPWSNSDIEIDDGKIDKAKGILEDGGWKEKNGVRQKEDLKAEFSLYYPADEENRQSLAIAFADMMKPLNIKVNVKGKSWDHIAKKMHSEAVLFALGNPTPLEYYYTFSTKAQGSGYNNVNYYSNATVDKNINKAFKADSIENAYEYWKKAQWDGKEGTGFKGDASWVWLVNLEHLYFIREGLEIGEQKLQPHGHNWPITDFIENWHWKE